MRSPLQQCLDEANRQIDIYKQERVANPQAFGSADGFFDGTPEDGPMALPVIWFDPAIRDVRWRVLWGVHKHQWPLTWAYCFGWAKDSRGERTAADLVFDMRDLPKRYIGRFNLDRDPGCARKSHRTILTRAFLDNFDLTTIAGGVA